MVRLCGAIIDAISNQELNAQISLVVSDNPKAFALQRAKDHGIATYVTKGTSLDERDIELANELERYEIDLIVLAGYLKMIGPRLIDNHTIINTHPSLLPAYGGKGMYGINVHTAVIEAKEEYSGVTVHYVNGAYDEGSIIAQSKVVLEEGETPESLSAKVQTFEKVQLINVIKELIREQK